MGKDRLIGWSGLPKRLAETRRDSARLGKTHFRWVGPLDGRLILENSFSRARPFVLRISIELER